MDLNDLIHRKTPPTPWEEGENIPWHDPAFSELMLEQHLDQSHDAASRRYEKIDEHVRWIHRRLLAERPTRILDLACGPGLYTQRLAGLGHECVGIDYAPSPISYAMDQAHKGSLACAYELADVRDAEYGARFNLVMMVNGQINVFRRSDARSILAKAFAALDHGGLMLLEPQRFATVEGEAKKGPSWWSVPGGLHLFAKGPHLCLEERFWDAEARTGTTRYFVIDPAGENVAACAMSAEAYSDDEFKDMLTAVGFEDIEFFPSLIGVEDKGERFNFAIIGRKPEV